MGNALSEEEENEMLEEAYALSLDSPDVDRKVNLGTAAADCQPKHTKQQDEAAAAAAVEVALLKDDPEELQDDHTHAMKHGRSSSAEIAAEGDHRGKRQHLSASEKQKKLSYIQMARLGYQELVNAIIRPPRADYKVCGCIMVKYETCCSNNYVGSLTHTFILHPPRPLYLQEEMLGPPAFSFCGKRFTRTDFTLMTKRGLNLQCSHWEPVERTSDRIPVVIYMHGNSSARVEVLPQLSYLLSLGLAVFAFDFAGSGKSDGEYVSLGYYEREDLMCVIAHLRATNVVSTIALWGTVHGCRDGTDARRPRSFNCLHDIRFPIFGPYETGGRNGGKGTRTRHIGSQYYRVGGVADDSVERQETGEFQHQAYFAHCACGQVLHSGTLRGGGARRLY
jgi:hypothetical protein